LNPAIERAKFIAQALYEKGGEDILVIDIEDKTIIADFFVICTGRSTTQVKALCDHVEEKMAQKEEVAKRREGYGAARWVVLDYSDILVHVFLKEEREFYNLERLWVDNENTIRYPAEAEG